MRYLIVERQDGGCDYTIGCGVNITFVTADDIDDAMRKYKRNYEGEYKTHNPLRDEMAVDNVEVFEITGTSAEINVKAWREEIDRRVEANKRQKADLAERAEFERLKKKYG